MARVIRRRWESAHIPGLPRRDRLPCDYQAYLPDPLEGRSFLLEGSVVAELAEAETDIIRLNSEAASLVETEAMARLLLRAESVASSWIEGLEVGGRRLLRAEAARLLGEGTGDVTAEEVLGNIEAMRWSIDALAKAERITIDGILESHRILLAGTRLANHAGRLRTEQNWIGGSEYNPCSAAFVPPPPDLVRPLMEDLCGFCNVDNLPAVAQAALAHAQFETIHPFADGNGRTGRTLIHVILRRRKIASRALPPVSLVLATWARGYVQGLTDTRYRGSSTSAPAREGVNKWIAFFASACRRAVSDAVDFEERIREIQIRWRERLGRVRKSSSVELLLERLPGAPILNVKTAAELIDRSFPQANEAIARLERAGILRRTTVGKRNRAFEARDILDAFTDLERQLASPGGNTRTSRPSRRAPAPRRS